MNPVRYDTRSIAPILRARRPIAWQLVLDREQPPFIRDALEGVRPAFGEPEARSGHQVLDGAGHEHLARPRQGSRSSRAPQPVSQTPPSTTRIGLESMRLLAPLRSVPEPDGTGESGRPRPRLPNQRLKSSNDPMINHEPPRTARSAAQ